MAIPIQPFVFMHMLGLLNYTSHIISYNYGTGLPNYVATGVHAQLNCKCGRGDSTWIPSDNYTCEDYKGVWLGCGQLAIGTCYMAGVVPMPLRFNRIIWKQVNKYLEKYGNSGTVIYRGCDYTSTMSRTATGKYLPGITGCYYVVVDGDLTRLGGRLVNYGYVSVNGAIEAKLPWWVRTDIDEYNWIINLGYILSAALTRK